MGEKQNFEQHSSRTLADVVVCAEMPYSGGFSERTMTTRRMGAYTMLLHLVNGEWDASNRDIMGAYVDRILANAIRQGVEIDINTSEQAEEG